MSFASTVPLGPIADAAPQAVKAHHGSLGYLIWLVFLLAAGFAAGSAGLALLERRMRPAALRVRPPIAGGAEVAAFEGPEPASLTLELEAARRRALRVGLTIAAAIGGHNFAGGLAVGVSGRARARSPPP